MKPIFDKALTGFKWKFVGSYTRGHDTIKDIDILITADHENTAWFSFIDRVLSAFKQYNPRVVRNGNKLISITITYHKTSIPIDFFITSRDAWGAAELYLSGKNAIRLRQQAKAAGYLLNRYGLFKKTRGDYVLVESRSKKKILDAIHYL